MGGWTYENEGFVQQTFLGASVRSFSMNGGFGSSSATLSVDLVNDEFNKSDNTPLGQGDDIYHSGVHDMFRPPPVGSPVFFKFGKNHADIIQAWRRVFDETYIWKKGSCSKIHPETKQPLLDQECCKEHGGNWKPPKYWSESKHPKTLDDEIKDEDRMYVKTDVKTSDSFRSFVKAMDSGNFDIPYGHYYVGESPNSSGLWFSMKSKEWVSNAEIGPNGKILNSGQVWIDYSDLRDKKNKNRGRYHMPFGGILQSYDQSRSEGGNALYSVNVSDPRDILSNTSIILADYAGTTHNNNNLINVYGFLEHDISENLLCKFKEYYCDSISCDDPCRFENKSYLTKFVSNSVKNMGAVYYFGDDMWHKTPEVPFKSTDPDQLPNHFPITGQGFSRRSSKGIPYYRVDQALAALFNYNGRLPWEYREAGYGGWIDFRGYKYVVDFTGIPIHKLPNYYFLDYTEITLLELAEELCEAISHDLYVKLMPVIDHPSVEWLHEWNKSQIKSKKYHNIVNGIIRVEAIDRSKKPKYGAIKEHIDGLEASGIHVSNSSLGYEASNVVTDKFVVGAQTTDMYFFHTNKDRDHIEVRKQKEGLPNKLDYLLGQQWSLKTSLDQTIIPFYGFIGDEAVTIPRGFGSYQQILLDATNLNAHGVGNYYVATEMELRAAAAGYEKWKEFLLLYNNMYMQSMEPGDSFDKSFLSQSKADVFGGTCSVWDGNTKKPFPDKDSCEAAGGEWSTIYEQHNPNISNNYGVASPRCVWRSDRNYVGPDGLPASPCSPPYGYPLYYKRAEKIGIPDAGLANMSVQGNKIISNLARLKSQLGNNEDEMTLLGENFNVADEEYKDRYNEWNETAAPFLKFAEYIADKFGKSKDLADATNVVRKRALDSFSKARDAAAINLVAGKKKHKQYMATMSFIEESKNRVFHMMKNLSRYSDKAIENSQKVYNFVKGVADKHLGKTFLVKLPKESNLWYRKNMNLKPQMADMGLFTGPTTRVSEIEFGPFGFRPQPVHSGVGYYYSDKFQRELDRRRIMYDATFGRQGAYRLGSMKNNYNPISDQWEFNYEPDTNGGYFEFDLYNNVMRPKDIAKVTDQSKLPLATVYNLYPMDMTNFLNDDGRVGAYARYDNSQYLNFKGVGEKELSQQVITMNGQFVPDLTAELDNTKEDKFSSFNTKAKLNSLPKTVAFVKIDIDEKLYLAPQTVGIDSKKTKRLTGLPMFMDKVFGRDVLDIGQYSQPQKIWDDSIDPETGKPKCEWVPSKTWYQAQFVPNWFNGGFDGAMVPQQDFYRNYNPILNGEIVVTNMASGLDPDHVYAKITMPGRITPTIDSRCHDGPYQLFRGAMVKNWLTMDTVKNFPGFEKPTFRGAPRRFGPKCAGTPVEAGGGKAVKNAMKAYRQAMSALTMASPEMQLHFTAPSPVYPDIVALPLRSNERCYGPWVSSSVEGDAKKYKDVGGKVEFVKEEGLAPWNYAGYQLMDEAGILKAQFSNSLLLMSEKGDFSFPSIPRGETLCKQLGSGGPLVTSINVDVGPGGLTTSYNMELYTPRFGKLMKRREQIIDSVSKERKKIRDANNALIRKGLAKGQSAGGFSVGPNLAGFATNLEDYNDRLEKERNNPLEVASIVSNQPLLGDDLTASISTYSKQQGNTRDKGVDAVAPHQEGQIIGNQTMDGVAAVFGEYNPTAEQRQKLYQDTVLAAKGDRLMGAHAGEAGNDGYAKNPYVSFRDNYTKFYTKENDNKGLGVPSNPDDVTAASKRGQFQPGQLNPGTGGENPFVGDGLASNYFGAPTEGKDGSTVSRGLGTIEGVEGGRAGGLIEMLGGDWNINV